jgi:soluble lytic murein transglycosylase
MLHICTKRQREEGSRPEAGFSSPLFLVTFGLLCGAAVGSLSWLASNQSPDTDGGRFLVSSLTSMQIIKPAPLPAMVRPGVRQAASSDRANPRGAFRALPNGKPANNTIATTLDNFATVLSPDDAARSAQIFSLLKEGRLEEAARQTGDLEDDVLFGHMQAMYLLSPRHTRVKLADLNEWLETYGDLPQASAVYQKAVRLSDARVPRPARVQGLSGNIDAASMEYVDWSRNRMLATAKRARKEDSAAVTSAPWNKAIAAYAKGEDDAAYDIFASLARQEELPAAHRAAAAFWAQRIAETQGNEEAAQEFLAIAKAAPRSFYGMLASAQSGEAPRFNWAVPSFGRAQAEAMKSHPAGKRALALLQIGERELAEQELRSLHPKGDDRLEEALLALSQRYAMPQLALQVGGALKQASGAYDAALYPLMPWVPDGGYVSDPALVLAVARHESRFINNAKSPVGASGIMQIMPDTAEKITKGGSSRLFDAAENVAMGDRYLKKLGSLNSIDNNLLLLIAAYNCGPGRLQELYARESAHGRDPLLFIETMPLKETRLYMQKVLMSYWAYRSRLGKPLTSLSEIAQGQWPRFGADIKRVAAK